MREPCEHHYVEVNFVDSRDDHGTGDVVVLVHGTGGSTETHFAHLHPMLATRQRAVGVDWNDPGTETLETQQLVDQVRGVIDQLELSRYRITLVGYSLGAVIAALVAAQQPTIITNLVLLAGWMQSDNQQLLRYRLADQIAQDAPAALDTFKTYAAFSGPYLAALSSWQLNELVANMSSTTVFETKQQELNHRISIAGVLGKISARTLVIGGEHDIMVPTRHQLDLVDAIARAQFVAVDAGHAMVFERPAELVAHIQGLIDIGA